MKTWFKLLILVVVLETVVAVDSGACSIDNPDLSEPLKYYSIVRTLKSCKNGGITKEQESLIDPDTSLDGFRQLFKDICPHAHKVATCIGNVTKNLESCENQEIAKNATMVIGMLTHIMTTVCEDNGERLAYIFHGSFNIDDIPFWRCFLTAVTYVRIGENHIKGITTMLSFSYNILGKLKNCLTHVHEEVYRSAFQWIMDEVSNTMKCKYLTNGTMVLCSEMDTSNIFVTTACQKFKNSNNLYSALENKATNTCYSSMFKHDQQDHTNYTKIEWLNTVYKDICTSQKKFPACLVETSVYGKLCLSQEEDKQFQLEIQAIEDAVLRMCVANGTRLAAVMHEVYKNTPEHGHAIRDCYKTVEEVSKTRQGHAVSTKNMRFYHDVVDFKQCVVEKLHATNDLALGVESVFNDVLKEMKCVNPADDSNVVHCNTIHEH